MKTDTIIPHYYEIDKPSIHLSNDTRLEYEIINDVHNEFQQMGHTRLICNNTNANLRLSKSLLSFTLKIVKADGTNLTNADNVAFANNFGANTFKQVRVQINDKEICNKRYVGLTTLVDHLLNYSDDHAKSIATREGLYLDTANSTVKDKYTFVVADNAIALDATYNKGYKQRYNLSKLSHEVNVSIPLSTLVEFFQIDKVMRGVIIDLELLQNDIHSLLIKPQANNHNYIVTIRNLRWIIPRVYPSLLSEQYLNKALCSSNTISYEWEELNCERKDYIESTSYTTELRISQLAKYVYVIFQNNYKYTGVESNMLFDHANVRKLEVTVDSLKFPALKCSFVDTELNYEDAYNAYVDATYKELDSDCGTLINKQSFINLYPLYCFDTSNSEMNVYDNPSDKPHFIKIECEFQEVPNVHMYVLYKCDKLINVKPTEGRITIVD